MASKKLKLSRYSKFWVALGAAAGVAIFALAPAEPEPAFVLTRNEWFQILVAFAGSLGVYQIKNAK